MRIEELINENDFNIFTNPQIEEGNIIIDYVQRMPEI